MWEGEPATVSRAVRFAYDVSKGSVRARRGKLTMGGCLKPLEDRKRQDVRNNGEAELVKTVSKAVRKYTSTLAWKYWRSGTVAMLAYTKNPNAWVVVFNVKSIKRGIYSQYLFIRL